MVGSVTLTSKTGMWQLVTSCFYAENEENLEAVISKIEDATKDKLTVSIWIRTVLFCQTA